MRPNFAHGPLGTVTAVDLQHFITNFDHGVRRWSPCNDTNDNEAKPAMRRPHSELQPDSRSCRTKRRVEVRSIATGRVGMRTDGPQVC